MFKIVMLVGTGGFLGSVSRYFLGQFIHKLLPVIFPYGTLTINILGCFFIGIILGLTDKDMVSPEWRFFLATGFFGGFTTFSTFAYENINLLGDKEYFYLFLYSMLSYVFGLTAAYLGVVISKLI